jgi:Na+-transporting NADH:ubiquinone oxidoreductase subunit A
MAVFTVKNGLDIKIAGAPGKHLDTMPIPQSVALKPVEFKGVKPKLLVKEGDPVKVGQPLFYDKNKPDVLFGSPGGGVVKAIQRGHRRVITAFIIELNGTEDWIEFEPVTESGLMDITRESIVERLLKGGVWPVFRQRPFGKIPDPKLIPRSIFVNGMDTEPLAGDPDVAVEGRETDLQFGFKLLKKLTEGTLYLTLKAGHNPAYAAMEDLCVHHIKGPHPAGLAGTHIRLIEPLKQGETVWTLRTSDVAAVGSFFRTGRYPVDRVVALSGEGINEPGHLATRVGAPVAALTDGRIKDGEYRIISGTVLMGTAVDSDGYMGLYDTVCTVVPESSKRDFMGWAMPGWKKFSLFKAYCSSLIPWKTFPFDTRLNGGVRPIVNIGAWEKVFALDIHLSYLVRAILAEDLEEAESLGLLEVTEEDVALCTLVCPSKMELGDIIRSGLDLYEKESI